MALWTPLIALAPEIIRLAGDLIRKANKNKAENLEKQDEFGSMDEKVAYLEREYKELLDISRQQSELIQNLARQNEILIKRARLNQAVALTAMVLAIAAIVMHLI